MKRFKRKPCSLLGAIANWIFIPLTLLCPVSLVLTWLMAQNIVSKPFDRALQHNLGALSRQITANYQRAQFTLPLPAPEWLPANDLETVYYQVQGTQGETLSGERGLPAPTEAESIVPGEVHMRNDYFRGTAIRVAYTWVQLGAHNDRPALVQVAETLDKRSVLATEIAKGVLLAQCMVLLLAMLLVWLALAKAIAPLHRLVDSIRARSPDDMSPLEEEDMPREVSPLVASVNDLLLRLKDSIATQQRFLTDAAHQLKTPLAGLRMQAELAQRAGASAEELKLSLRQIGCSSIRATHTVNQLLALARAETNGTAMTRQPCDLARLTMDVVRDCVPRAMEKHIDVGFEGAQPGTLGTTVQGNPALLNEMVRNLMDNALNYTPSSADAPGVITARVLVDPLSHALLLQVEDSGPGIALSERERVFKRFYRVPGTEADGSGLGLPIVLEIARQHQASVTISDGRPGQVPVGTCISVRFTGTAPATLAPTGV